MDYFSDDLNLDAEEEANNNVNNDEVRGDFPPDIIEELHHFARNLDFNDDIVDMKTPLISIPMNQLGIICTLLPTNNNVRLKWEGRIRRCYIHVANLIKANPMMATHGKNISSFKEHYLDPSIKILLTGISTTDANLSLMTIGINLHWKYLNNEDPCCTRRFSY